MNQPDRAKAAFGEAIRLDPGDFYSCFMRGGIFVKEKEYEKAIIDFDEAIRRAGQSRQCQCVPCSGRTSSRMPG